MPSIPEHRPRPPGPHDLGWMHALNALHEVELSPLTVAELKALIEAAQHVRVVDERAAFLIAFAPHAAYDNPNLGWFKARYDRFIYVDRVVVDAAARGRGLARLLYDDLFDAARAMGSDTIVCEVNADPPNPASDAFHAALGFVPVGEVELAGRGKTVRYMRKAL
jgi:predicted GNAT superfamily acetyltransferase